MLRIRHFLLSLVLTIILLFASCSESGIESTSTSGFPTPENTDVPTILPSTASTMLPTETESPPAPLPSVQNQCVSEHTDNQKLNLNGVIVYRQKGTQQDFMAGRDSFFLLDLKNNTSKEIVDDGVVYAQISPDRKHLVYRYRSPDRKYILRVLDSNGKIISDFPPYINGRAQSFFNWQNAEQLRMIQQDEDSKVTIQLLNPFNQEHSILRTNWSGVYAPENPFYDKLVQWKFDQKITDISYVYGANILFDPTLTRVLYPKDGSIVSLTDVENEAELVQGNFTDWGRLPQWSLDGENLAIVNREGNVDEFYLVNRNGGEFERITDFASEFDYATIPDYTWSPDGSQIAFWLELDQTNVEDGPQSELAILDIPTRQVTRLCIEGISNNAYEPWVMNHPEIHWSPDGNYIMITTWDDPDNRRNYSVLVVDPLTGAVEEISQNTAPIGWMVKEE